MKRWLLSPLLFASIAVVAIAYFSWQSDQASLDGFAAPLQGATDLDTQTLPEHHVVQVFLQGQPDCPFITWLDGNWFTIHGHNAIEIRPGKTSRHFVTQLRKLRSLHPQCTTQRWIIHGRFTPQQRSWIHAS